jgi:serine/threonine protein kinase
MPGLSRDQLPELTVAILREGKGSRPEVRLLRHESRLLVLKDYSVGNTVLRLLGLLLLRREREAYERLAELPGVPAYAGRLDRYTLLVEYVAGESASVAPLEWLTPEFFGRLEALIRGMHACGVVHGDLKRLDNILITPEGEPVLIDFSAAFWHGSSPLAALVFPHIWDDDLRAPYKLKSRRVPHLLTPEERRFLRHRTLVERWFRWWREYLRRPVQKLAGSELEGPPPRP